MNDASPPAGWFADPNAPTSQYRYWDGSRWTDQVSPMVQQAAQAPPAPSPHPATVDSSHQPYLPHHAAQPAQAGQHADPRFSIDRFVVRQNVRLMVNKYEVFEAADESRHPAEGRLLARVQQKRMALKERINYQDADGTELMHLQAQKRLDIHGRNDIYDARGGQLGGMAKEFKKSLIQSTWNLFDAQGRHVAIVQESSLFVALFRRFRDLIPYIGGFLGLIPVKYGFTITAGPQTPVPGAELGRYTRRIAFRDIYDMDLRADTGVIVDRRLAIAMAIALDALQNR